MSSRLAAGLVFLIALSGYSDQPQAFTDADIAADSEIGYVRSFHDETPQGATGIKCTVVYKGGLVKSRVRVMSQYGRTISASYPKADIEAYMKLWRALQAHAAMTLEAPYELLMRSKTPEDGPYERFETSHDWYRFAFRCKDKVRVFDVYCIDLLKDKRYKTILDEIDRFVKLKPIGRNPSAVTTVIY